MLDVRGAGIDKLAGHSHATGFFLELDAEIGRVCRIFLLLAKRRRPAVDQVHGRIVRREQRVGRILGNPRQDLVTSCQKLGEIRHIPALDLF